MEWLENLLRYPIVLARCLGWFDAVIYPFIVNDPGEAHCKRHLGAVTLGHIPPPLRKVGSERYAGIEALLDEFSMRMAWINAVKDLN